MILVLFQRYRELGYRFLVVEHFVVMDLVHSGRDGRGRRSPFCVLVPLFEGGGRVVVEGE